jgi:hypothetical protein
MIGYVHTVQDEDMDRDGKSRGRSSKRLLGGGPLIDRRMDIRNI